MPLFYESVAACGSLKPVTDEISEVENADQVSAKFYIFRVAALEVDTAFINSGGNFPGINHLALDLHHVVVYILGQYQNIFGIDGPARFDEYSIPADVDRFPDALPYFCTPFIEEKIGDQ
jgi:hypothetical protein